MVQTKILQENSQPFPGKEISNATFNVSEDPRDTANHQYLLIRNGPFVHNEF